MTTSSVKRRLSISNILAHSPKRSKTSRTPHSRVEGQELTPTSGLKEAEDILRLLAHDDLEYLFTVLLKDPQAGPVVLARMQSNKSRAHASAKARAKAIYESLIQDVSDKEEELEIDGDRLDGMQSAGEYPDAMKQFMPIVQTLIDLDTPSHGPELAWKALLKIATVALSPGDRGEIDVNGDEEDNDDFHELVDAKMLAICKAQVSSGDQTRLGDSRRNELLKLRKRAVYTDDDLPNERYALTLEFLNDFLEAAV